MARLITLFFFLVHVFPFFFVRSSLGLVPILFIFFIILAYGIGWYLAHILTPKVNLEYITFTECRSMSILIVLLGYLLLRTPIIYEIIGIHQKEKENKQKIIFNIVIDVNQNIYPDENNLSSILRS